MEILVVVCIFISSEDAFGAHVSSELLFHFLKLCFGCRPVGPKTEIEAQFWEGGAVRGRWEASAWVVTCRLSWFVKKGEGWGRRKGFREVMVEAFPVIRDEPILVDESSSVFLAEMLEMVYFPLFFFFCPCLFFFPLFEEEPLPASSAFWPPRGCF